MLFVIGRKGSGKTTLLDSIQRYKPKYYTDNYKTLCSISAENINLNDLYNELIQNIKPDFNLLDMSRVFDVFWEVFLTLQCIYTIGVELEHFQIEDSDSRKGTFEKIVRIFKRKLGKDDIALDDYSPKSSIFKLSAELIINYFYNGIPEYINVEIDGHNISISLYSYLLRLSFWRPRDIIKNFAVIMKLSNSEVSTTDEIIQEILKTLLTINSDKIIEEEFIGEYKNVYKNLSSVLSKFKNYNLINEYNEFIEKLSKIDIESVDSIENKEIQEKFKILYKLGVIGIYLDKKEDHKHGYGYHICYVFNEVLKPCEDLLNGNLDTIRTKVIFNMIFLKNLELNINTNELICDYDWNYISKNHLMKDTIGRI